MSEPAFRSVAELYEPGILASVEAETKGLADAVLTPLRTAFLTGADYALPSGNALRHFMAQHPTVYTAIDKIVTNLGSVELELLPLGSDDPVTAHPLLDLLDNPNPLMDRATLLEHTRQWLELWGNAFWLKNSPARSTNRGAAYPTELLPLDPECVRPWPLFGTRLEKWEYAVGGQVFYLPPEEVVWFRFPNPYDTRWGLSWVRPLLLDILGDHRAAEWNVSFYRRGAIPAGVIVLPETATGITETECNVIRERWIENHRDNRAPAVMTRGAKYEATGTGQKESDFLGGRRYSREQILSAAGVPPGVAGIMEYANYANLVPQKQMFWTDCLIPKLRREEATLTRGLIPRGERLRFAFSLEEVNSLLEDVGKKAETAGKFFAMGLTLRQVNDRLGMGFDLDDNPIADTSFLPFNLVPAEQMLEPIDVTPAAAPPIAPAPPEDEAAAAMRRGLAGMLAARRPKVLPPPETKAAPVEIVKRDASRDRLWRRLSAPTGPIAADAGRGLRSYFTSIRSEVMANLDTVLGDKAIKINSPNELMGAHLFDEEKRDRELQALLGKTHKRGVQAGGDRVMTETGSSIAFDLTNPRVHSFFANKNILVVEINETLRAALEAKVRNAVGTGLADGLGATEIASLIREEVGEAFLWYRGRALTIARTETGEAYNFGRVEAMEQNGVEYHTWLSSDDELVRESHAEADGVTVKLGDTFPSTGLTMPQEVGGPAEEVINCRCLSVAATSAEG